MKKSLYLALPLVLGVAACSRATQPELSTDSAVVPQAAEEAAAQGAGGLEPVTNWKSERKRLAKLGLSYADGVVTPVEAEARQVLDGLTRSDLDRLLAEGRSQYQTNHQLDAIATFTRVVLLDPKVASHYLELGQALEGFKLEQDAETAYQYGHSLDAKHVGLASKLADMSWRHGDREDAVVRFQSVLELDPENGFAWGRLARAHFYAKRDGLAWEAIHRAQDLGEMIPPQMIAPLAARTPEPIR